MIGRSALKNLVSLFNKGLRLSNHGLFLVLTGFSLPSVWAADPVLLFEDNFEAATATASYPTVGSYGIFRAGILSLIDLNSRVTDTAASGNVLQLARSQKLQTGQAKAIARLERPAQVGEYVRFELDARLGHGSALQFGFGSAAGGVPMGQAHFYTIIVSLSENGSVSVFNGTRYEKIPDLSVSADEWQHYTLSFLVGSEEITLKAGDNSVVIPGPFADQINPITSVDEIFLSTANDEIVGEFDNLKVSIIESERPAKD